MNNDTPYLPLPCSQEMWDLRAEANAACLEASQDPRNWLKGFRAAVACLVAVGVPRTAAKAALLALDDGLVWGYGPNNGPETFTPGGSDHV